MKQKFSSEDLKWMIVIFGMIIAFIEMLTIIVPLTVNQSLLEGVLFLLFLGALGGLGLFVLIFLGFGLQHPKWYVKSYTVVCLFWEFLCAISWFGGPWLLGWFYGEDAVLAVPPLIPIWYWCYKRLGKEEEQKRKEAVDWELEDQLKILDEQLHLGTITQEEYEQKKKDLLRKFEA